MDVLDGYIERISFQSDETGYTVAYLVPVQSTQAMCIVGILPGLQPGETVRCEGAWTRHLVYGKQFKVESYSIKAPADLVGIQKYLGSGLIRGIGDTYAERIVAHFGLQTLDIIDKDPDRLSEVRGVGPKRVEKIKACWGDQRTIRDVMVFLQGHGISPSLAQKIFKVYGKESIQTVKGSPYRLARDIRGVGFKTADQLASKLGLDKNSPQRIEAGIEYLLSNLSDEGHVCYPQAELLKLAEEILEVSSEIILKSLEALEKEERLVTSSLVKQGEITLFVWLKPLHVAESGIARELLRLKHAPSCLRGIDCERALAWAQDKLKLKLAPQQAEAVQRALSEKVQVITGGPGTGKSTITKAILSVTAKLTSKILLCAPTGRAAKRMSEITGFKAATIHSLLEFDFRNGGFKRNQKNPLDCDLIIVDESSMIDTPLLYHLLRALPTRVRLVLIGDIHQLPSVGPGNVLRDIIESGMIPMTSLTEIFRQAAGSQIITNAHRIHKGQMPDTTHSSNSDFYFIEVNEPEEVLKTIVGLVTQRLPTKFKYRPLHEIQVLAPMKRGVIGIENMNLALQQSLNPRPHYLLRGGSRYAVGDKVMQLKNNYQKEVYNGDIGYIREINAIDQEMVIAVDERELNYSFSDLDELTLAYAVSVHKYQGSECRCIVMPIHTTHFKLLHRNLLYTGVTRGKELVVLVGTKKALALAVQNDEIQLRHTGLRQALVEQMTRGLYLFR